jgi:hypothetical protein
VGQSPSRWRTSSQVAADHDGVTRGALLGAVDRYRRKINGPPKGPPQHRKRAERAPGQIITDKQLRSLYNRQKYDRIEREVIDNAPVSRGIVCAGNSINIAGYLKAALARARSKLDCVGQRNGQIRRMTRRNDLLYAPIRK